MKPEELKKDVYAVGAVDWDRRLFDALIPLPDGTSYNSYLIKAGEASVLLDTVDPSMTDVLFNNLGRLGVGRIDYVIAHHAEQDHSGSLPAVLAKHPAAKVVCTPRCQELLTDLLLIPPDRFKTVADKETLTVGGRTLEFIYTPWVHWPETMCTYLKEEKLLFSCDFFGSHLAASNVRVTDEGLVHEAALRYYAEIMMPFRKIILGNLEKLKPYAIEMIAPSHGPVHVRPEFILDAYRRWSDDKPGNIAVLPYISMHGSTRAMVSHLVQALAQRGVTVKQFDLASVDLGKLAAALVDAATIVIGTPTVLAGPHPSALYAAFLANALRPKAKFASIIGSYGWGGKTVEQITSQLPNLKVELLPPVLCKGLPEAADFKMLDDLAATIAQKHKDAGLA